METEEILKFMEEEEKEGYDYKLKWERLKKKLKENKK